jgi:hypothetical protein
VLVEHLQVHALAFECGGDLAEMEGGWNGPGGRAG